MHQCPECNAECYCDGSVDPVEAYEECVHYLREACVPEGDDEDQEFEEADMGGEA